MASKNPFDKQHAKNVARYQLLIDTIFEKANKEMAALGAGVIGFDPSKPFRFADYPMTKTRLNMLVRQLNEDVTAVIVDGCKAEWTLANDKNSELARRVFGDNIGKLSKAQYERYFNNHEDARDAFIARKTAGLNLSDRVWRYTTQYKEEMEMALDLGIRKGQDSRSLARDMKQYLKNPDALFRRVRDEHGQLRLSKAAQAYHPGAGVYRSAYKNALRLTGTETNIAYRTADHERWKDFDFVVGIEVKTSKTNHKEEDICDCLKGKYPKDFKFVGWHPQCRCYVTTIRKTEEEFLRDLNNDTDTLSENAVTDVPQGFKQWVSDNSGRISRVKDLPYFLRDNGHRTEDGEYVLKPLGRLLPTAKHVPTALEVAAARHAARTKEDVAKIKDAWTDRKDTIQAAEDVMAKLDGIPDIDMSKLKDRLSHADWAQTKTLTASLNGDVAAINGLTELDDPWGVARKFSLKEATEVNAAIQRTFARWRWDLDSRTSLDFLKAKLEHEINVVSGASARSRFRTWEVSRDAFKKRLDKVNFRIERDDLVNDISEALKFVKGSRAKANKAIFAEWEAAFKSEADMTTLKAKAQTIKDAYSDHLAKEAAKAAKTRAAGMSSVSDVKTDFEDFCHKHNISVDYSEVRRDKYGNIVYDASGKPEMTIQFKDGGVYVYSPRVYDALSNAVPITAQERSFAAKYVQTSNSFSLNGKLDDVGGHGVNFSTKAHINPLGRDKYNSQMTATDIKDIQNFDGVVDRRPLPFAVNVIRMNDSTGIAGTFGIAKFTDEADLIAKLQAAVGRESIQHRFTSTSTNPDANVFKYRNVIMRIRLKKGIPAYFAGNAMESEVVLGRDTIFKLLHVTKENGKIVVNVEVV